MLKRLAIVLLISTSVSAQFGLYVDEKPNFTIERALPIARRAALAKVPDLDHFILHSVEPRVQLGDEKGKYWHFLWQELPFKTRMRGVFVKVYMKDGSTEVYAFKE
jgi:hypothetical protein